MINLRGEVMRIFEKFKTLFNFSKSKSTNYNQESLPTGRVFEEQIKIDLQKTIEYEKNSTNPKFHRTEREKDLSFNFSYKHSDKLQSLENELVENVMSISTTYQIDERIERCKIALESYEKLKKFCFSKGKGGQIYFEDMWEHCHNSKNPDFRYIERVEKEYNYLTQNYEEAATKLKNKEIKAKNKILIKQFKKNAESEILKIIQNNPGILQTEIYDYFDVIYKNTIRNVIKKLESEGKIKKNKSGNTYKIYISGEMR